MSESLSVRDYFDVVLPTLLRWKGPAAAAIGVNVRFVVTGKSPGTWTIRLRPPMAGVVPGSEWKADVTVKIQSDEMLKILAGTFDAKAAITAQKVEISGDLSVLKRVAFLFQAGGGTPLEMRSGQPEDGVKEQKSARGRKRSSQDP